MTETPLRTSDFDFVLPADRIAQHPATPREAARLLCVGEAFEDRVVADLPDVLRHGDLLVVNDTKVIPAQLSAMRGAARIGITLDRPLADGSWHALARNARRLQTGDRLDFDGLAGFHAVIAAVEEGGGVTLRFDRDGEAFSAALAQAGALALPPYIARPQGPTPQDQSDYQTMFADRSGAVAAPTAGLHFTPALLAKLQARGVGAEKLTLHVGAGTFLPVRSETLEGHSIHAEHGVLGGNAALRINAARKAGSRIVAVGTTSLRLLETATGADGTTRPFSGETNIFLHPGRAIRSADMLLTNFHLPRIDAVHAGLRLCRHRTHESGLRACHRRPATASTPTATRPCCAAPRHDRFGWTQLANDGAARAGTLRTAHGEVATPVFMPVGTAATVKAMTADAVRSTGASIVLGNTYHLMLRPGPERVEKLGGLHRMMDWPGPILTDSGGFQIMSLDKLRTLDADGVTFRSHLDGGTQHRLTPERAIDIQHKLDATITMVLDECTAFPATHEAASASMEMSMRWAARCRAAFVARDGYALFGIVQGSIYPDLRRASAAALTGIGFDGYAIGGLAVGEGQEAMFGTLEATVPHLPADAPTLSHGCGHAG